MARQVVTKSDELEVGSVWLCMCIDEGHTVIIGETSMWVQEPPDQHGNYWSECEKNKAGLVNRAPHPSPDEAYADLTAAQLLGDTE